MRTVTRPASSGIDTVVSDATSGFISRPARVSSQSPASLSGRQRLQRGQRPFAPRRTTLSLHCLITLGLLGSSLAHAQTSDNGAGATVVDRPQSAADSRTEANTGGKTTTSDTSALVETSGLSAVSVKGTSQAEKQNTFVAKTVQTGQYKGLDAIDTPATINVVTSAVLQAQAATGLYDALRNTPGVYRQQLSGIGYDQLAIRGIAPDNRASYFLDGVLPFDNNIWMPMEDKERVEVLKGATALYYGFTVPAGVVNMVMKRAGDMPVTTIGTVVDSHGSVGVKADIARRFGKDQQFGLRVNAMDEHVETPIDGDRGYRKFVSVAADWKVNNKLSLKYDLENINQKVVEQAGITPLTAVNGVISLPGLPNASKLLVPNNQYTTSTATAQLLRADYLISDNWSANFAIGQSITQRNRRLWIFRNYNVNTGAGQLQESVQNGQRYENQDIRAEVNGLFKTGPVSHDLTVGVQENWQYQPSFTTYYYTANQNLYNPIDVSASLKASGTPKAFYADHIQTQGVYLYDRIALSPRWELTPGVRYSRYHETQYGTPEQSVTRTSPTASLLYKATPSTSIYASYVEGLESPGSAPATATNAYQSLPAAVSRQEELGVKQRLPGDALLTVALFNLRQPAASTDASGYYGLSGMGQYRGIEFAFQGDVTKRLSLVLSGTYLHARLEDAADASTNGKRPEDTPKFTASAFANYKVPYVNGLSLNGGAYFISARPINDANQAFIGGYTLFSAGIRYQTTLFRKHASFQLNVDNALNRHYWASAGSSQLGIGLDRTFTLTSTIDF
ncbi:TonB-dependent receptor [Robbsia sp. KACC 23696]|uniref:TonB-dependent siderophore receptor n=1 Tax=Robbsia sp. KACC 23696 TaxID=3149231 RepID=UPI00325AC559